jgi:DNA-binding beta-propeller fold protein YncE
MPAKTSALLLAAWLLLGQSQPLRHHQDPRSEDIPAARTIQDPYPVFNGIAVDPQNDVVVMSDSNRKSVLLYDRRVNATKPEEAAAPRRQIIGTATNIGFVAGVVLDPRRQEIFTVNNDIEDTLLVLSYEDRGNVRPRRMLSVPHQSWGLALSPSRDELVVSVEMHNGLVFYRRDADGTEPPLRNIHGPSTGLADPHGIFWDEAHNEIAVANHGNFRGLIKNLGWGCVPAGVSAEAEGGEFRSPSITFYAATAKGDQKPLRAIQGARTQLDWPMGLAVDSAHNEVAVANNGDNSVLIFHRGDNTDAAPERSIRGDRTGINRPMGVAIDPKNDELWVSNFGDHTALVFARDASGNASPKRILRNAPAGTPTAGFGNPMALAYDSKREEILVPN